MENFINRRYVMTVLAALTMMQSAAHAEIISDLPNPGDIGGESSSGPVMPPLPEVRPEQPATTTQSERVGSVVIDSMSRKSGGELYRVQLGQATVLSRLEITILKSRLKISKVDVITERGQKIAVRELTNLNVENAGAKLSSGNLNISDKIVSIEITGESYSAEADIRISALSVYSTPQLLYRRVVTPPPAPVNSCSSDTSGDALIKSKLDMVTTWGQRMDQAASGSTTERFAATELERYVQDVLSTLNSSAVNRMSEEYMKQLFDFYHRKYNAAPSGSRPEAIYIKLRDAFGRAHSAVVEKKLNCLVAKNQGSSTELMKLLEQFAALYQAARSGSAEEAHYLRMVNQVKGKIMPAFKRELDEKYNFRTLEKEYQEHYAKYQRVPSGHLLESFYLEMSRETRKRALEIMRLQSRRMSAEERFAMIQKYDEQYRRSSFGSEPEKFAQEILAILAP